MGGRLFLFVLYGNHAVSNRHSGFFNAWNESDHIFLLTLLSYVTVGLVYGVSPTEREGGQK